MRAAWAHRVGGGYEAIQYKVQFTRRLSRRGSKLPHENETGSKKQPPRAPCMLEARHIDCRIKELNGLKVLRVARPGRGSCAHMLHVTCSREASEADEGP